MHVHNVVLQIPVKKDVSIFLTQTPSSLPTGSLPPELKAQFRQVTLSQPDLGLMLKGRCSSLGLKAPPVLAMRLKLVTELARDQL